MMSDHHQYLARLRESKKDQRAVAFFDLDRTLISVYSALPLLLEQLKAGQVSSLGALQQVLMGIGQARDVYHFEEVLGTAIGQLSGVEEAEFRKLGELLFHKHLRKRIFVEALHLIDAHRKLGHTIAVVSSATRYQVEPVAEAMGIEHVLCTELEVKGGHFTGVVSGQACWEEGKQIAAEDFCTTRDLSLDKSWFYTDALDDLPLMDAVKHPVAVNPSRALRDHARAENWPILDFNSRKRATARDLLRTAAMYGSLIPARWLGKAKHLLGAADKKSAALEAFTTYSEVGLELAGVKLQIKNEKYLWETRPAIFVINHQSVLDGYIAPILVKRDYVMMGKRKPQTCL